ncbi:hypothetical protein PIB30_051020 [Stylosanthes scabra]|uniref:Uncharacterized protein n=1 Tax=Stylosanthes scabra TaxID=79078 RepID=A0ABU6WHD7_9FABA|nr:hypothetical protein [Stylosanthes scabra]
MEEVPVMEKEITPVTNDKVAAPTTSTPLPYPAIAKRAQRTKPRDRHIIEMLKKVEMTLPLFEVIWLADCVYDLGACISIMPLSIYKKLHLDPLKQSSAKPFLRTAKFKLDAFSGTFSFSVGPKVIKFNVKNTMITPIVDYSLSRCDVIDELVVEVNQADLELMPEEEEEILWNFEETTPLMNNKENREPDKGINPKLKHLLPNLKYAYLGRSANFQSLSLMSSPLKKKGNSSKC